MIILTRRSGQKFLMPTTGTSDRGRIRPTVNMAELDRQYGGIGPYTFSDRYEVYWIPGRQLYKASMPIPVNGSLTVLPGRDSIMWLPALQSAKQSVFFYETASGPTGCANTTAETITGAISPSFNVFYLQTPVKIHATYCWRVDTVLSSGRVVSGDTWTFTVGGRKSHNGDTQTESN